MRLNEIIFRLFGRLTGGKDAHAKELLSGGAASFTLRVLGMIVGYSLMLFVTKTYGASTMGIYALCLTILSILSMLTKIGLDTTLVKYVSDFMARDNPEAAKGAYVSALTIVVPVCLIISISLYFSSSVIARYIFHKEYLTPYLKMVALALLPFSFKAINESVMRGLKRIAGFSFFQYVSMNMVTLIVLASYIFLLDMDGDPVEALVISIFTLAGMSFIYLKKSSSLMEAPSGQGVSVKKMLTYSVPLLFGTAMITITAWTDTIMLGMMGESRDLGIYSVALRMAALVSIMLLSFNSIAGPQIASLYGKKDMQGMRRSAQQAAMYSFWFALPIFTVLTVYSSFVLGLFGSEFSEGSVSLKLLLIGQLVNAAAGPVGLLLQMTGKQRAYQNIAFISMVINITLNALLIPVYGINGAAFASMTSLATVNIMAVLVIKRHYGFIAIHLPIINRLA